MNPTLNLYFVETRDEIIQKLKERKRKEKKKKQAITRRTFAILGT